MVNSEQDTINLKTKSLSKQLIRVHFTFMKSFLHIKLYAILLFGVLLHMNLHAFNKKNCLPTINAYKLNSYLLQAFQLPSDTSQKHYPINRIKFPIFLPIHPPASSIKNQKDYIKLTQKIVNYYVNHGYPFVKVNSKQSASQKNELILNIEIDTGSRYTYGDLFIKSEKKINQKLIQNIIQIRYGKTYKQNEIDAIGKQFNALPFLKLAQDPQHVFFSKTSDTYLYLSKEKANQFSGIIGVNTKTENNVNKTFLTGNVNFLLYNAIQLGEKLQFDWQQLNSNSQTLDFEVEFPFLLHQPIGTRAQLNIYKRDSSSSQNILVGGISYKSSYTDKLEINYKQERNIDLLNSESKNNTLISSYGLIQTSQKLNQLISPKKGYSLMNEIRFGTKKISIKNEKNSTFEFNSNSNFYIPFYSFVFKLGLSLGSKNYESVSFNELYQLGGSNNLRGFLERSIFASSFLIYTTEIRFPLDEYSFLHAFWNQSFYEQRTAEYIQDQPFGFGIGASIRTGAGLLNVSYALGKEFNNPVEFKNGKIHFGIRTIF